ncbi:MAG: hypothetical protein JWO91_2434 [Acidobacteriaceae bacterium]|nr:hypothetical protein [Acidobacteriaceae bacterium]
MGNGLKQSVMICAERFPTRIKRSRQCWDLEKNGVQIRNPERKTSLLFTKVSEEREYVSHNKKATSIESMWLRLVSTSRNTVRDALPRVPHEQCNLK